MKRIIPGAVLVIIALTLYITRPIKIGVLFSLDSSVGNEQNLTAQFYAKKYKRIGLRPVKLIIETPSLGKESITEGFHSLRERGVVAIIGSALSVEGMVTAPLAEEYGIPIISPTVSTSKLSNKKDNFYQLIMNTTSQGINTGRFLNKEGFSRTILILSRQNRAFSESLGDGFSLSFKGETKKVFNDPDNPDFEAIRRFKPDSIFFIVSSGDVVNYLKFLREEFPDIRIVTSSWGYQQLLQVFSGPQIDGINVVSITGNKIDDHFKKESMEFEESFKLKTTYIFGLAYSGMEQLYMAIDKVGTNRKRIIDYLDTPRSFQSSHGKYWINEFGDTVGEFYYFYNIQDNQIKLLEKFPIEEYNGKE